MPKILGLITARGGSKGIPGKNTKPLLGKPLIAYTIEAASQSGALDRIIVSTDDDSIAQVARASGAEVPFMRPPEFSTDTASHIEVVRHALSWLEEHEEYRPDYVMILQPTSPARQPFHIMEAAALIMGDREADSVLSVARVPDAFSSKKIMRQDGTYLRLLDGSPVYHRVARRQDLPEEYYSAGLIFLFRSNLVVGTDTPNLYGERTLPYVIAAEYLVDINEPEDWLVAEEKMRALIG